MKLNTMTIENFKGLKSFTFSPAGKNATITGANGTGKTTVFDAFLWLFYGKDSTDRKDFGVQPLDSENNRIPHLVTKVEAEVLVEDVIFTLRKELHENRIKDELRGYLTKCWINEVPKKVGEYAESISEIVGEDTFKLLTDPHHFNNQHWTSRRAILMDLAKDLGDPEGFDDLLTALNGRSIDDYKKVLTDQKKRIKEEADQIGPRIDEITRGTDIKDSTSNKEDLQIQRTQLRQTLDALDADRKKVTDAEKERQRHIDDLNRLRADKIKREGQIANNTDGIKPLLEERDNVNKTVHQRKEALAEAESTILAIERGMMNDKDELESCLRQIDGIRKEYKDAQNAYAAAAQKPVNVTSQCPTCKQPLPEAEVAAATAKANSDREAEKAHYAKQMESIKKRGDEVNVDIENAKKSVAKYEETYKLQHQTLARMNQEMEVLQEKADKKLASIQKKIDSNELPDPKTDPIWLAICEDINKTEAKIGDPVTEALCAIDKNRKAIEDQIADLTITLANHDRIAKDTARIRELETRERELAQQMADIQRDLQQIEDYKYQQGQMIEAAVNGKFEHVTFRLFKYLINGTTEECCDATFGGVPYNDCSYGQKILMGVDIINTLAEHLAAWPPLWLDNSESLTYNIQYKGQTIRLAADAEATEIKIA
jgi:DNA repair exonuclease SbcCD ATPase subunit